MNIVWLLVVSAAAVAQTAPITLETSEREWLTQLDTVRVGVPEDSAPIIYFDENGIANGLDVDFLRLMQKRTPISLSWKVCGSWDSCLQALRHREIDILSFASDTPARREYALFTEVYWETPWAIASRDAAPVLVDSFTELAGRRVAMVDSYSIVKDVASTVGVELFTVDSPAEGLEAVLEGQADGYIDSLPLLVERVREQHTGNLRLSILRDEPGDAVRIAVRSDWPQLVPILNRSIATITENERAVIAERWFDVKYEAGISAEVVRRWGLRIGIVVLAVVIAFGIWNSQLRKEIRRRKEVEKQIRYLARHDDLTDLPNRHLLKDRLAQALALHKRNKQRFALLFIDLDGFKAVNDEHGHDVGDELLVQVAGRLKGSLREQDTVCRFGGDEFIILLTELGAGDDALQVAHKLVDELIRPYSLSAARAEISASVGIALYPDHGKSGQALMRVADKAMYEVKHDGKNGVKMAALPAQE
ncbi:diguanylate cyclase domain-containing protein [Aliidiomarina sp. Khilg15.8]